MSIDLDNYPNISFKFYVNDTLTCKVCGNGVKFGGDVISTAPCKYIHTCKGCHDKSLRGGYWLVTVVGAVALSMLGLIAFNTGKPN